jgi:ubiquinone/menaquinone biosynthesis C-methylase UbiE
VLDAGCGTGYLSSKLRDRGGIVIGVDFAENMIEIARSRAPDIDFRVDCCSVLRTVADGSIDLVIANYVLMDSFDLGGTMRAFSRVLKDQGAAIVVFSHPCFPQGRATKDADGRATRYDWPFSYFEQRRCVDPPWGHFTSEFIWFHRPLSDYWKAFVSAGFDVEDFEEPRMADDRRHLAERERDRVKCANRPYSVAFKLRKTSQRPISSRASGAPR